MNNNPTVLEIDAKAVEHNIRYFRSKLKEATKLLVVIKAFAYGSDSILIGKLLEQQKVDYLAVAYTDEGIALRNAKIKLPILILHPQIENFDRIIAYDLEPNLYSFRTLSDFYSRVKKTKLKNYPVHIKINSGMNRLGFQEKDIPQLKTNIQEYSNLNIISFYSHFAASEDANEENFTKQQMDQFDKISSSLSSVLSYSPLKHISNTSGIINFAEAQFDMVRLGIGLYGFGNAEIETANLKNVCNLKTKISQIQHISIGETVSYNRRFTAKKPTKIAILPIGYADGLNRNLGNGLAFVFVKNQKARIVGTICMDMTMIDITDVECKEGDEVVIFNHQDHILDLAKTTNTIPYEILTSISQRVNRKLI
ncbi:MAG: alanine racemase [Flavobacteriaceae bacterium]|nr:alanine racemase [Flavobacteriaceae bacterium]